MINIFIYRTWIISTVKREMILKGCDQGLSRPLLWGGVKFLFFIFFFNPYIKIGRSKYK
jgi:hypothetical protein